MCFEDFEENDDILIELFSDTGVCRKAQATPGLLGVTDPGGYLYRENNIVGGQLNFVQFLSDKKERTFVNALSGTLFPTPG